MEGCCLEAVLFLVGGPKVGEGDASFRRLREVGGVPPGWSIYPHAGDNGKALHLVEAVSSQEIFDHLQYFEDIYERGEIVEILERP